MKSSKFAAILILLFSFGAQAEEQKCSNMGAACLCSEPLQATSYTALGDIKYDATDSTTKECHTDGVNHSAVISAAGGPIVSSDATALAALPSGHSVSRFLRRVDDHLGMYMVGGIGKVGSSTLDAKYVRIAARWYIYRTPIFDFVGEETCNNSKVAQLDAGVVIDYDARGTARFHEYNFVTWTPAIDCCLFGPDGNPTQPTAQFKGKWWTYEIVITNRSGPATNVQMYIRNVTDNGPEIKVIDMAADSRTNNLTPPVILSRILVNNFRSVPAGTSDECRGWVGTSHYLFAGWETNSGQRIGPALEIEGGGLPPAIPPPPTNLRVQ